MKRFFIVFSGLFLLHGYVQAELYKSVDADGHITYSNIGSSGAKKVDLGIAEPPTSSREKSSKKSHKSSKNSTPAWYPRVDNATQKQRDGKRKMILNAELNSELEALAKAKQSYQEIKKSSQTYNSNKVKSAQGLTKHEEKLKEIEAEITTHQRNVTLLTKELAN